MKKHLERWQWIVAMSLGALLLVSPVAARAATPAPAPAVALAPSHERSPADGTSMSTSDKGKRKQLEYDGALRAAL